MRRLFSWAWLSFIFRTALGVVFFYAGLVKSQDPGGFAQAIYNYRILPGWLINPVAVLLPWVEMVLGASLVLGIWVTGASLLASGFLGVFALALCLNLARGLDIECGCFSTGSSGPGNTLWYFLRDILLLAMAIEVVLFDREVGSVGRLIRRRSGR